jgi:hypothetical protein
MVSVDEVMAAAEGLPRMAGRSAVYRWMMLNRKEFARQLGVGRDGKARPDWNALALSLGRFGLLNRDGKLPTAANVRLTWWRVRRDAGLLAQGGVAAADALVIASQPDGPVDRRPRRGKAEAVSRLPRREPSPPAAPSEVVAGVREIESPKSTGPVVRPTFDPEASLDEKAKPAPSALSRSISRTLLSTFRKIPDPSEFILAQISRLEEEVNIPEDDIEIPFP